MHILLSDVAHRAFADAVVACAPKAHFSVMARDGSVHASRASSEPIEIAWATHDLFVEGPSRAFFAASASSPGLRWFQSSGAGVDSPFFVGLMERGIKVTISHVASVSIAEFVMRSVLQWFQKPELWEAERAERRWGHHFFREVIGTTWLVIGVGSIGTEVALRARSFGATVIGVRRHRTGSEPVDQMVTPARLLEVVPPADVVVVSAPATAQTANLVNEEFLEAMRARSVLVNIARGSLVDEAALLRALDRGRPEVAICDAVSVEPPPSDSPLWTHPRVVLTPHNSFAGEGTNARNGVLFLENLARYIGGRPLLHQV